MVETNAGSRGKRGQGTASTALPRDGTGSTRAGEGGGREPLLRAEGLSVRFEDHYALHGVDLEVRRGEDVAVIGPSDSGKSTLLCCLNLLQMPYHRVPGGADASSPKRGGRPQMKESKEGSNDG
jgi:ABC-type glutathione transport system ATPase component